MHVSTDSMQFANCARNSFLDLIPRHERRHMLCCCRKKAAWVSNHQLDSGTKINQPELEVGAFTAGSCTLSDLIHEVPRLLEMLDAKSLVALMATNSVHNTQIHNLVTSLTIHSAKGVAMLRTQLWPLLTGLTLSFSTGASVRSLWDRQGLHEDWVAMQSLVQANLTNLQSLSITGTLSIAAQTYLCKASWPKVRSLRLTHASLTDENSSCYDCCSMRPVERAFLLWRLVNGRPGISGQGIMQ